jgi:hypothetical protein
MPLSVSSAFEELHRRLTPLPGEVSAASSHRASVEAALESTFKVHRFFQSGSWGNGTSIRRHSDVDYFVSLDAPHRQQSSTVVLDNVRAVLAGRFPKTNVVVDAPAVRVDFGYDGSERYEVVPAFVADVSDTDAFRYEIPDEWGRWRQSSPEGQKRFVAQEDQRLKDRLRPLIRFMKLWKYMHDVPISSYYLELLTTYRMRSEATIIYSWDIGTVFEDLYRSRCPAITNPPGVPGSVDPCWAYERAELLEAVLQATVWADLAKEAEGNQDDSAAFYWWGQVFKGSYPRRS